MDSPPTSPVNAAPALRLRRLAVSNLRICADALLQLGPHLNILSGDNGQGKTTILEAIYLVATSKSFRTARVRELIAFGKKQGRVEARFEEDDGVIRKQCVELQGSNKSVTLNGKQPTRLSNYAHASPVVIFHAPDQELSAGSASGRRTLLDRVALFSNPAHAAELSRYQKALKSRMRVLLDYGTQDTQLDVFERLCAEYGSQVVRNRQQAANALGEKLADTFPLLAAQDLDLATSYEPKGSVDEDEFARALRETRLADMRRKSAGYGPQRDELRFDLNGKPARVVASQGQHRSLTLALKLAELHAVAKLRGVLPLLLLDDLSSELDGERTNALLQALAGLRCQIVVTTTRPQLIQSAGFASQERRLFRVHGGGVEPE